MTQKIKLNKRKLIGAHATKNKFKKYLEDSNNE